MPEQYATGDHYTGGEPLRIVASLPVAITPGLVLR
ncbi:hypothetical protein FB472_1122 [Rhodoglobus vestalii]|uniref:Uncharacterized protein n=1 Tax=Rhodoglobus vestalii TaxID=193384 RepID=A0A8H2K642_9MICO|nr:hypothetical protein FB472_1122 [Rhodoglobus vestalii]